LRLEKEKIDDNIINYYNILINLKFKNKKAMIFNTHFYCQKNLGIKDKFLDLKIFDFVIFPIFSNFHWILLILDLNLKKILYFDSLPGIITNIKEIVYKITVYINQNLESTEIFVLSENFSEIQKNGVDCGLFVLFNTEKFFDENFKIKSINEYRKQIFYTIVNSSK
jgi:Ulp1 family protease